MESENVVDDEKAMFRWVDCIISCYIRSNACDFFIFAFGLVTYFFRVDWGHGTACGGLFESGHDEKNITTTMRVKDKATYTTTSRAVS